MGKRGRLGRIYALHKRERASLTKPGKCDDRCPGWVIDADLEVVQRCDECARYVDDLSARAHVRRALRERQEKRQKR